MPKEDKRRTVDVVLPADSRCANFEGLLLLPEVLEGLKKMGFVRPSPIQLEAIPVGRCGFDLVVQAKSGTGKTCVFSVIALESLNRNIPYPQVLVIAPTREIVVQIAEVVCLMGQAMPPFNCCTFIGGLPIAEDKLKVKNCQIAVGTPGRIKQLISEKLLKTDAVRLFVLDEADKLLEDNFQNDINWIYRKLPSSKQMLAFSATYPETLAQMLATYMQSPTFIRLNAKNPALHGIKQFYSVTPFHPLQSKAFENKVSHVSNLLGSVPFGQCMIFSNYQMRVQGLCDRLNALGWPATYICGKMTQMERLQAISKFKDFKCRVLISTDLTARGIDIECVNIVINLDVPYDVETYLHRIGRAGRFGTYGIAVTFATEREEMQFLQKLKKKGSLEMVELPERLTADLWHFQIESHDSNSESFPPERLDTCQSLNGVAKLATIDASIKLAKHAPVLEHPNRLDVPANGCPVSAGLINHLKGVNDAEMENRALAQKMKSLQIKNNHQQDSQVYDRDSGLAIAEMRFCNSNVTLTNLSATSMLCDLKEEKIRVDNDLEDLQPFLKTDMCKKCAVCSRGESIELLEIASDADSCFMDNDSTMKQFLASTHSRFIGQLRNDCSLLSDSEKSTKKFCTVIDGFARIMDPLFPSDDTGESQGLPLNAEQHLTESEQVGQTNLCKSLMGCKSELCNLCAVDFTRLPTGSVELKARASISQCSELSSTDEEVTYEENEYHRRETVSRRCTNDAALASMSKWWYDRGERAPCMEWSSNRQHTLFYNDQWHRILRAQKHSFWLSEYVKLMVSRRVHL